MLLLLCTFKMLFVSVFDAVVSLVWFSLILILLNNDKGSWNEQLSL